MKPDFGLDDAIKLMSFSADFLFLGCFFAYLHIITQMITNNVHMIPAETFTASRTMSHGEINLNGNSVKPGL